MSIADEIVQLINDGWTRHSDYHFSVKIGGRQLDYWPTTAKMRYKDKTYTITYTELKDFINQEADKIIKGANMNSQYDNTNRGALFVNDRKQQPNHPDFKGSADEILCPHCQKKIPFWISAWKKMSKAGVQFMSMSFSVKEQQKQAPVGGDAFDMGSTAVKPEKPNHSFEDFDDDIPF